MGYIITNKERSEYVYLTPSGGVVEKGDRTLAQVFPTQSEAVKIKNKAPVRLKKYIVESEEVNVKELKAKELKVARAKELKKVNSDSKTEEEKSSTPQKAKRITFNYETRIEIYNKGKGRCGICGRFTPYNSFTIDHIIPLAKGGTNDTSNLQCACKVCNTMKQDILPEDLMEHIMRILKYQLKTCYNKDNLWEQLNRTYKEQKRKTAVQKMQKIGKLICK